MSWRLCLWWIWHSHAIWRSFQAITFGRSFSKLLQRESEKVFRRLWLPRSRRIWPWWWQARWWWWWWQSQSQWIRPWWRRSRRRPQHWWQTRTHLVFFVVFVDVLCFNMASQIVLSINFCYLHFKHSKVLFSPFQYVYLFRLRFVV